MAWNINNVCICVILNKKSISENFFSSLWSISYFFSEKYWRTKILSYSSIVKKAKNLTIQNSLLKSFTNAGPLKYTLQRRTRFSQLF